MKKEEKALALINEIGKSADIIWNLIEDEAQAIANDMIPKEYYKGVRHLAYVKVIDDILENLTDYHKRVHTAALKKLKE